MLEKELAQKFVEYFSCYDLYFEVDYGACVDIVAINGKISTAIEVKTSFNFKVLEQAANNRRLFNFSYIAVPMFKDSSFQKELCGIYGVGLVVYNSKSYMEQVVELVKPKLNRHVNNTRLMSRMHECNKLSMPGTRSGDTDKVTAFGVTRDSVVRYVQRNPGCSIKTMVKDISHHYRSDTSANSCIYQYICSGIIPDISIKEKKLYYEPKTL